jgi:thermostable 8-oxoguanine DNA glycosylase
LAEETVFCLLGGHGISAEMAAAVFYECKKNNLIKNMEDSEDVWIYQLSQKVTVNNRQVSYRFPKQKAKYISGAISHLKSIDSDIKGRGLRDKLLNINGIGPKTAGWIVRNCYGVDDVAIIDIHIQRAGQLCGFFEPSWTPERHYSRMEDAFLEFCCQLCVRPSLFDYLIWDQMRRIGSLAIESAKKVVGESKRKYQRTQPI